MRHPIVRHESVEQPKRDVGEQKKGDYLSAWFEEHLIARRANALTGFSNEHSLHRCLNDEQTVAHKQHDVFAIAKVGSADDHA